MKVFDGKFHLNMTLSELSLQFLNIPLPSDPRSGLLGQLVASEAGLGYMTPVKDFPLSTGSFESMEEK